MYKEGGVISTITGRTWTFGDRIDTDLIASGKYLSLPMDEMKTHVLEAADSDFAGQVKAGDIIVAGRLFGCGSSREAAPAAIKALGVAAVAADSFARTFYRNAIAIGLPAIFCPGVSTLFEAGHEAAIDFATTTITNTTTGKSIEFPAFPAEMLRVLESGGIRGLLAQLSAKRNA
jgi:3-isopropylmalate dehydratase small subunit